LQAFGVVSLLVIAALGADRERSCTVASAHRATADSQRLP